jgi:hypothetical protein
MIVAVVWQVVVNGTVVVECPTRLEAKAARRELRDAPRATIRRRPKP